MDAKRNRWFTSDATPYTQYTQWYPILIFIARQVAEATRACILAVLLLHLLQPINFVLNFIGALVPPVSPSSILSSCRRFAPRESAKSSLQASKLNSRMRNEAPLFGIDLRQVVPLSRLLPSCPRPPSLPFLPVLPSRPRQRATYCQLMPRKEKPRKVSLDLKKPYQHVLFFGRSASHRSETC